MTNPVVRRLYLQIWLAVAGCVIVLSLLLAGAWSWSEQRRDSELQAEPAARPITLADAPGAPPGSGEAVTSWSSERGLAITARMDDGRVLQLQLAPRARSGHGSFWHWLRPPYGFLWMLLLAGFTVMVGVLPVARRLTRRLEGLQHSVQRWGRGELQQRAAVVGHDEVSDLARHFNQAADRIEGLVQEQQRLVQSQKTMLANASHELRSPLARIRMALELLESPTAAASARTAQARAEIGRNVGELDTLVEEILLASRLDSSDIELGPVETVDLIGLLAEECARVGAVLQAPPDGRPVAVPGVPRLLRRALRNLLENGKRHGRADPSADWVQASVQRDGPWAVVLVDDAGPGVPAADRERIFEPFYRLAGASEQHGGIGLGLALVRAIAQRHGGSVACQGRPGGKGARFVVRLPLSASPGA